MVVVKRSYTDKKTGNEIALQTPQVKIGNNLGEDEEVIVVFKKGCYENKFNLTKKDEKTGKDKEIEVKSYSFLADFSGEDVYVKITELTYKKMCGLFGVSDPSSFSMLEGSIIKFKRTIVDGRTIIEVSEHVPEM